MHLLKKALPEIPRKVTIAAAAIGHLRESVLARSWQEARPPPGTLAMVVGWWSGHFIGRTSKEENAWAFLEGKAGHSGYLGRGAAQRTCRKFRKYGPKRWFLSQGCRVPSY